MGIFFIPSMAQLKVSLPKFGFNLLQQFVADRGSGNLTDDAARRAVLYLESNLCLFKGMPEEVYVRALAEHYRVGEIRAIQCELTEIYHLPTSQLPVPSRVRTFFEDHKLNRIGYVVQFSRKDFVMSKNFGLGSFAQMMDVLHGIDSRIEVGSPITYVHDSDAFQVRTCLEQPVIDVIINPETRLFRFFERQREMIEKIERNVRVADFVIFPESVISMSDYQRRNALDSLRHLHPSIHFGMDKQYLNEKLGIEFAQ